MLDPRIHDVEELVEASVFHPSPARRLRAQVLHNAAKAAQRQQFARRLAAAGGIVAGVVIASFIVIRLCVATPVESVSSTPASDAAIKSSDLPDSPPTDDVRISAGRSFGESLFTPGRTDSPNGAPADRSNRAGLPGRNPVSGLGL
jgi:hypothetical protein